MLREMIERKGDRAARYLVRSIQHIHISRPLGQRTCLDLKCATMQVKATDEGCNIQQKSKGQHWIR